MRTTLSFAMALVLLGAGPASARPDRITRVVVYPDRAQVTRVLQLPCGQRVTARFTGIPPAADPLSLRAQSSLGTVDGLRSEERVRDEAYARKAADLEAQIHKLEVTLAAQRDEQARAKDSARVATQYGEVAHTLIGREMSEPPNLRAWTDALDSVLKARLQSVAAETAIGARLRELDLKLGELRAQRDRALSAAGRHEYLTEVIVTCPAGQTTQVELLYLVGGSQWEPAHEGRFSDAGGAVELQSYATIRQTTGEDWTFAQVILSTAIPRQNATPPTLGQLRVYTDPRTPPKKVVVSREEYQRHAEAPADLENAPVAPSGGKPRIAQQGLSVQFVLPEPADVPGDGTPARLLMSRASLKAQLKYRAVPKLLPYVFRVADLVNTAPYPLLPGPIDVFRRGQFLARYPLSRVASGERFQLTFGLEENLKVQRTVIEEVARDRGLLGNTRRHRYAYHFDVGNYLQQAEDVELAEHIPVSELDEVKVGLDGKTTAGYEMQKADGILTWRLRLRPGEKRPVELVYHVDVPASYEE